MTIIKTISIDPDLNEIAVSNKVSWTEASRLGMTLLLYDMELIDFTKSLQEFKTIKNYLNAIKRLQEELQEANEEIERLNNEK